MSVEGNRDVCIGAGMCVLAAPGVFDQDDDGPVVVLAEHPSTADGPMVAQAVTLCPSGAVRMRPGG